VETVSEKIKDNAEKQELWAISFAPKT
jgi:hypothetical protein